MYAHSDCILWFRNLEQKFTKTLRGQHFVSDAKKVNLPWTTYRSVSQ